jgi:hypothetical protein
VNRVTVSEAAFVKLADGYAPSFHLQSRDDVDRATKWLIRDPDRSDRVLISFGPMARSERELALQEFRDLGLRISVPDRRDFELTRPSVRRIPTGLLRLLIFSPWLIYLKGSDRYPKQYFVDGCSNLGSGPQQGQSGGDPSGDRSPTGGPKTPPLLRRSAGIE